VKLHRFVLPLFLALVLALVALPSSAQAGQEKKASARSTSAAKASASGDTSTRTRPANKKADKGKTTSKPGVNRAGRNKPGKKHQRKHHKPRYSPPSGAIFNNPRGNAAQRWRIIRTVNAAIRNARPDSRIYISLYMYDSRASTKALLGAHRRGVGVQMVVDHDARNHATKRLQRIFNRDNIRVKKGQRPKYPNGEVRRMGPDRSFLHFCHQSCRDGGDPNHTKFYVFTRTGRTSNVVMVSSSNLNQGGANKGWNDLVVLKNRGALVDDFRRVHREMAEDTSNDHDGFLQFRHKNVVARFYPRKKPSDPVIGDLQRVRCHGARGGAGRKGRTAINISMFRWNNDRGLRIAKQLVAMNRRGCHVNVIYGAPGSKIVDVLKRSARSGGIKLWDSRYDFNGDRAVDLRVHEKYTAIGGHNGKDKSSWSVQTGSANWGRSLHAGDENTLTVYNRKLYRQYMHNWTFIAHNAARRIL
jgi:hypothetical protein